MKDSVRGFLFLVLCLLVCAIAFFLNSTVYFKYSIFLFALAFVLFLLTIHSFVNAFRKEPPFDKNLRYILNTFDSILVKSNSIPSLEGRSIIEVNSFEDLIDAQLEVRKPICYLRQLDSCSFVLLDDKAAYCYIEKSTPTVVSPLELELRKILTQKTREKDIDAELLQNIDKTTIVKLSNLKSYKISPVRKKEENSVNSASQVMAEAKKNYYDQPEIIAIIDDNPKKSGTVSLEDTIEIL